MDSLNKIVIGLSGGVDSAVSAALLLSKGYKVVGVYVKFLDSHNSETDIYYARKIAKFLKIEFHVIDACEQFEQNVIVPFCNAIQKGKTPSPCVFCNRFCKIPLLLKIAHTLGIDKIATGHYAQIEKNLKNRLFSIKKGIDQNKDQSYMLSLLTQEQLQSLIFPLAKYHKTTVRKIAKEIGLPVANKKDSQDLCFVSGDYRDFLVLQNIENKSGDIELKQKNEFIKVGTHRGLHNYTIGQRKGIGLALGKPVYVIEKDINRNVLVVSFIEDAKMKSIIVDHLHWFLFDILQNPLTCLVKVRYRSKAIKCKVFPISKTNNKLAKVVFDIQQDPTAPGQYAVFYNDDMVLGNGEIIAIEYK